jgi:heterodisulfide reductase subunit A-like polyferredoxin
MVGMEASDFSKQFKYNNGLDVNEHGFFSPINPHNLRNLTSKEGIFLAGTAIGPMYVGETLDHAR